MLIIKLINHTRRVLSRELSKEDACECNDCNCNSSAWPVTRDHSAEFYIRQRARGQWNASRMTYTNFGA